MEKKILIRTAMNGFVVTRSDSKNELWIAKDPVQVRDIVEAIANTMEQEN